MSEYSTEETAGAELTPEQEAYLRATQATQAAAEVAAGRSGDAGAQQATMATAERGPLLPAEQQMDQMMAQVKAMSDQLAAQAGQIEVMQRAEAQRVAESGGPLVLRYAQSVKDHLLAHAIAHPDLGAVTKDGDGYRVAGHFAGVIADADRLVATVKDLVDGKSSTGPVHDAADAVDRFIERGHRRLTGKHVDFGAAGQALEYVRDEASKAA
jgi:hypothetical protein